MSELGAAVAAALEAGRGSPISVAEGGAALVVAALPSGGRVALDAACSVWLVPADGGGAVRFEPGVESRFLEVLEVPRRDFEDLLEAAAREAELPVDAAVLAFPAEALILAILALREGYTARLALRWILPSERGPLKPAIAAIADAAEIPRDVRDLAKHLAR